MLQLVYILTEKVSAKPPELVSTFYDFEPLTKSCRQPIAMLYMNFTGLCTSTWTPSRFFEFDSSS